MGKNNWLKNNRPAQKLSPGNDFEWISFASSINSSNWAKLTAIYLENTNFLKKQDYKIYHTLLYKYTKKFGKQESHWLYFENNLTEIIQERKAWK